MKCPHCNQTIAAPFGWTTSVYAPGPEGKPKIDVVILTCPNCQAILGVVNKPEG